MTGSSAGVRETKGFPDLTIDLMVNQEQNFIGALKVTGTQSSFGGIVGLGETTGSGAGAPVGRFLETGGGTMIGPIAYFPVNSEIDTDNNINVGLEQGSFSSYVKVTSVAATDDLETIIGASFAGQVLILQGTNGKTITLKTTGNIIPPGVADFDLVDEAIISGIFDPDQNKWVFYTSSGGGGNVPDGTTENDHLQWDSGAWVARQTFQFGGTDTAMADNGFLRFLNDTIIIGARTGANDGNLEIKITTQDEFDFTASNETTVALLLRSQHATEPDQLFKILQGSGTGASGGILAQNNITFTSNLSTTNMVLTATNIQITTPILTSADGTLTIGTTSNRFLSMHAAQFGLDTNERILLSVGAGMAYDSDVSHTFDIGGTQKFQITSGLIQMVGNAQITANLNLGQTLELNETSTPTPASDTGYLYAKAVTTETHLFYVGDGVSEIDLTPSIGGFANRTLDNLINVSINSGLFFDTNAFYSIGEQVFTVDNIWLNSLSFDPNNSRTPATVGTTFGAIGEDASGMWVNIGSGSETFRIASLGTELFSISEVGGGSIAVFDTPSEIWFGTALTRGEIKHSGGDLILNRGNAGVNDGIDLQTFGNSRLKITEAEIDASVDINLNGKELQNVENIHIGTKIIYDFGPANFIEFTSNGILIETDNVSDDIRLDAKGTTSDVTIEATQFVSMLGFIAGVTGTSQLLLKSTDATLEINNSRFSFFGEHIDFNQEYLQFDGQVASGVTQQTNEPKLFANSDNDHHLTIRSGDTGNLIDLEDSGGGGANINLSNLASVAVNSTITLNNFVDIIPNVDIGSSLGDSTHAFSRLYVDRVNFNDISRFIGLSGANDMILEIGSGNDMLFKEAGTTFWALDGGDNICKFFRDIEMTGGEAIRANGSAEIGFFTTNSGVAVGGEGTVELPAATQSSANKASADSKYGASFGCIGIYDSGTALNVYIRQNDGNWSDIGTLQGGYDTIT